MPFLHTWPGTVLFTEQRTGFGRYGQRACRRAELASVLSRRSPLLLAPAAMMTRCVC
ncbi:hypothetical protein OG223_48030 [Streptomyces sp. NBC_01478]|uniref:hypothetical protein n=1 Tax=Streptomyces sp. NBC_01478 TaxID=2903882 RepID=UPI002E32131B|nr:hypothetical protein [Streptomyces sp. NBC_01478]